MSEVNFKIIVYSGSDEYKYHKNPTYKIQDGLLFIIDKMGMVMAVFKEYSSFHIEEY